MSSLSNGLKVMEQDQLHVQQWPLLPPARQQPTAPAAAVARRRAEHIEAQARAAARQLLVAAREKANQIQAEAYQAGYEEGFRVGQAEAVGGIRSRVRLTLTELRRLVRQVVEERHRLLAATSSGVLELAAAVSRKILAAEIDDRPERLLPMLQAARRKLQPVNGETVTVYAHPMDLAELGKTEDMKVWPGLKFVADAGLSRGDLLLESQRGRLDLRLETQLRHLLGHLESAPNGTLAPGEADEDDHDR